ncbi:MAG: hypothetical protein UIM25_00420 [Bacteroidales bacterium]|nr:hypothetical protein [Bacteroidales bacterium]
MKLSEIKGERAIEVIADLIEPLSNIAIDPNIKSVLSFKKKENETAEEAAVKAIQKNIPVLLKHHKKDVAKVLGVLEGVDPEKLNILEILKGLTDMMTDKALMQLFSSAVLTEEAVPHTEEFSK